MVAGVCSGIAQYFDVKPALVRIIFVALALVTGIWVGGLLYLILVIVMQDESSKKTGYT
ncbi:hypothetical protein CUN85_02080 [Methanolobus halotolerans]|uniref:Phage shock protein PspC N-terminal domain-containing protein n=2 Tax=Methanolobus halotolerans TaxID=2052935 RepID=A0A4E0QD52_9EURY|nr:hypothetical protein CUN85_02080 [Methanolobus halotolerans]